MEIIGVTTIDKKMSQVNNILPGPKVIKLFFMLNSAEHKVYHAH